MDYLEYQDYLCHYGVKGMKWGVRRGVRQTNKLADRLTRNIGKSHAVLSSSKGYRAMSAQSARSNKVVKSKIYEAKSKRLLDEYNKLDAKNNKNMAALFKIKYSTVYKAYDTGRGKKYVDQILGENINMSKVDEYEKKYSKNPRYSQGYSYNRQHIDNLASKRNE